MYWQFSADVVIGIGIFVAQVLAEYEIVAIYTDLKQRVADTFPLLKQRGREDLRPTMNVHVLRAKKTADGFEVVAKGITGPAELTADLVVRILRELNSDEPN